MAEKKTSSKTAVGAKNANKTAAGKGAETDAAKATTATAASGNKEKSLTELTAALAEKIGLPKNKTKEFLDAHAELLITELQTIGSVQLAGIGKLKLGERAERQGRNPATGEAITIKASKQIKFAGGKAFKDRFK